MSFAIKGKILREIAEDPFWCNVFIDALAISVGAAIVILEQFCKEKGYKVKHLEK